MNAKEHIDRSDKIQAVMRPLVHALNNRALATAAEPKPVKMEELTLMDLAMAYCETMSAGRIIPVECSHLNFNEVLDFQMFLSILFRNTAKVLNKS